MRNKGQSILEYVLLISVVAAALLATYRYILRATGANLKLTEEQINTFTVDPKQD